MHAPNRRLSALDGLRGIAAVSVVVYHTLRLDDGFRRGIFQYRPDAGVSWLLTVTPVRSLIDGSLAVWVFFVLSGFVLSRRFWRGERTRWGRYAVRRAIRLYVPVWGSAVVAIVLLGVRQLLSGQGRGLVDFGAAGTSIGHIAANLGLVTITSAPVDGVWWSMRWEVWFSALLPLVLLSLAVLGCGPRRRFTWTPMVFGAVCGALIGVEPWMHETLHTSVLASRVQFYLPMFGVGAAVAAYEHRIAGWSWWRRPGRGWVALATALVVMGVRGPLGALRVGGTVPPLLAKGGAHLLSVLGAGMLVAVFLGWRRGIRALSTRPLAWVGTRSYSLYLVHLPLLHVCTVAFAMESSPLWYIGLVVAASLVLAAGFYRFVEAPSIRLAARVGRPGGAGRHGPPAPSEPAADASPVPAPA